MICDLKISDCQFILKSHAPVGAQFNLKIDSSCKLRVASCELRVASCELSVDSR